MHYQGKWYKVRYSKVLYKLMQVCTCTLKLGRSPKITIISIARVCNTPGMLCFNVAVRKHPWVCINKKQKTCLWVGRFGQVLPLIRKKHWNFVFTCELDFESAPSRGVEGVSLHSMQKLPFVWCWLVEWHSCTWLCWHSRLFNGSNKCLCTWVKMLIAGQQNRNIPWQLVLVKEKSRVLLEKWTSSRHCNNLHYRERLLSM